VLAYNILSRRPQEILNGILSIKKRVMRRARDQPSRLFLYLATPWVRHPLPLLQRVGFHTVRRTVSKFRNGRHFVPTGEDKCQGTASAVP
jgi:hypothetical protein